MTEFNLSEKMMAGALPNRQEYILKEDAKAFIKRLKEEIKEDKKILRMQVSFLWDKIDKLAGDDLK